MMKLVDKTEIPSPAPVIDPEPKGRLMAWLWPTVCILLLGATSGVWYWHQTGINDLNSRLSTEQQANSTLSAELAKAKKTVAPEAPKYTSEDYKFTLALTNDYTIVNQGAYGDGVPVYSLLIAKNTSQAGVVVSPGYGSVTLYASNTKKYTQQTYEQWVTNILGTRIKATPPTVTVDGVTADVYKVEGLSTGKMVFFQKADIYYRIYTDITNDETDTTIADVINGFKFN